MEISWEWEFAYTYSTRTLCNTGGLRHARIVVYFKLENFDEWKDAWIEVSELLNEFDILAVWENRQWERERERERERDWNRMHGANKWNRLNQKLLLSVLLYTAAYL